MQRQKTKYFLAREQEYMSKLIAGQVKEGEGKKYHEKVLDTYIIIIAQNNVFIGNTALKDQKIFEIDVVPMVVQTKEIYPGNKMYWKFFELTKFKESDSYKGKEINKISPLKEQWLEFLVDCSEQKAKPDRAEIIKKGYEIMKVANWTHDKKTLYWKQKADEEAFFEELKDEKLKLKEGAFKKGKLKGEIKGEISMVKNFIKFGVNTEKFKDGLNFLTSDKVKAEHKDNFIDYIGEHLNECR